MGNQSQSSDPNAFLMLLAAATGMPQTAEGQAADGTQTIANMTQWPGLFGKGHEDARKMNQRFSICCEADADTQTAQTADSVDANTQGTGIDSILEGFGLLSFKMEGICQEDSGQTVNDVPTTQPSLETIARKQQSLPQWMWAVPNIQAIQTQDAGDAQAVTAPAQGVAQVMPDTQYAPKAMPELRDAIAAMHNQSDTGAAQLGAPDTVPSDANETTTPTGQAAKAALFEGLQQALGDASTDRIGPGAAHVKQAENSQTPQGNAFDFNPDVPTIVASAKGDGASTSDDAANTKAQDGKADQSVEKMQPKTAAFGLDAMQKPQSVNAGTQNVEKTAQTQGGEKPTAADMAHNAMKIVQSIQSHEKDGNYEMSVTLRPESLGKVSIKLVMDDTGIKAQIKAESAAAKEALGEQINTLAESLKEKGIQVNHLEVTYEAPAFNTQQQYEGRNRGQSSHRNLRAYAAQNTQAVDSVYAGQESDLAIKNGSIEFQA